MRRTTAARNGIIQPPARFSRADSASPGFPAGAWQRKGCRVFVFDILASVVILAVSVFVILYSGRMPPALSSEIGPGYWPGFLGYVLFVLGLVLLGETLWKKRIAGRKRANGVTCEIPPSPIDFFSPGMIGVYKLLGIFAGFVVLLYYTSFLVSTVFLVPCCMRLLGEKRLSILAVTTACVPVAVYVIFVRILGITLP